MRNIPIRPPSGQAAGSIVISNRDIVRCPICKDAGYLRGDFPTGHPMFGKLFPCECKTREQGEKRKETLSRLSNLEAFGDQSFESFDPSIEGVDEAYESALAFAQDPGHRWMFLYGKPGTGKTHLAVSIAKYAMENLSMSVYFAAVPDLLDHLRSSFDPEAGTGYDQLFTTIKGAQILVLDDLGTESATPWAREKLYQVINYRYVEQLPTVVTSNVDLRKVDDRIMSRILDHRLSTYVEMDAEDFRRPGYSKQLRRSGRR
jgi:DNA replication protein DnaC